MTLVLTIISTALHSQETAAQYFNRVSERYALINDYSANLTITKGDVVQKAVVFYKDPNLLRLDFEVPNGMVIAIDGKTLQVWVPDYNASFSQSLRANPQARLTSFAGSSGLELIKRYYTISYDPTPDLVPLNQNSSVRVTKIKANWKSNNEGFRRLELSIDTNLTIRRIRGITTTNEEIVFDFANIVINRGIPTARFQYKSPPTGNTIENFLFDPEN